jgi:hypothetical protein
VKESTNTRILDCFLPHKPESGGAKRKIEETGEASVDLVSSSDDGADAAQVSFGP